MCVPVFKRMMDMYAGFRGRMAVCADLRGMLDACACFME